MPKTLIKGNRIERLQEKWHRSKCRKCGTKFEYQGKETWYRPMSGRRLVRCPECNNVVQTRLLYEYPDGFKENCPRPDKPPRSTPSVYSIFNSEPPKPPEPRVIRE